MVGAQLEPDVCPRWDIGFCPAHTCGHMELLGPSAVSCWTRTPEGAATPPLPPWHSAGKILHRGKTPGHCPGQLVWMGWGLGVGGQERTLTDNSLRQVGCWADGEARWQGCEGPSSTEGSRLRKVN